MIEATSCGGVVIHRGKILALYKSYRNRYDGSQDLDQCMILGGVSFCTVLGAARLGHLGLHLLDDRVCPLSWVVGDQGVYRANMQSERERKRGERIAVTNLRTPDEI